MTRPGPTRHPTVNRWPPTRVAEHPPWLGEGDWGRQEPHPYHRARATPRISPRTYRWITLAALLAVAAIVLTEDAVRLTEVGPRMLGLAGLQREPVRRRLRVPPGRRAAEPPVHGSDLGRHRPGRARVVALAPAPRPGLVVLGPGRRAGRAERAGRHHRAHEALAADRDGSLPAVLVAGLECGRAAPPGRSTRHTGRGHRPAPGRRAQPRRRRARLRRPVHGDRRHRDGAPRRRRERPPPPLRDRDRGPRPQPHRVVLPRPLRAHDRPRPPRWRQQGRHEGLGRARDDDPRPGRHPTPSTSTACRPVWSRSTSPAPSSCGSPSCRSTSASSPTRSRSWPARHHPRSPITTIRSTWGGAQRDRDGPMRTISPCCPPQRPPLRSRLPSRSRPFDDTRPIPTAPGW